MLNIITIMTYQWHLSSVLSSSSQLSYSRLWCSPSDRSSAEERKRRSARRTYLVPKVTTLSSWGVHNSPWGYSKANPALAWKITGSLKGTWKMLTPPSKSDSEISGLAPEFKKILKEYLETRPSASRMGRSEWSETWPPWTNFWIRMTSLRPQGTMSSTFMVRNNQPRPARHKASVKLGSMKSKYNMSTTRERKWSRKDAELSAKSMILRHSWGVRRDGIPMQSTLR